MQIFDIMKDQFLASIQEAYSFKGDSIVLGGSMFEKQLIPEGVIRLPLKTMNRHGLIAGATGTGKTKTLQLIAEQLSEKGVELSLLVQIDKLLQTCEIAKYTPVSDLNKTQDLEQANEIINQLKGYLE